MKKSEFLIELDKAFEEFEKENSQKEFPITITVESKMYGKKVFHTDSLFLTAHQKEGIFTFKQSHGARNITMLMLKTGQIDFIEEIIKNTKDKLERHIYLSMLKDILDKYRN